MGTASAHQILKVPGDLYAATTDLSGTAPFGGTALGEVRDMAFNHGFSINLITAEEWGGIAADATFTAQAILACVFRSFDADAMQAIFPFASEGSSGNPLIEFTPGGDDADHFRPGRALSASMATQITFVPRALDHHPSIVLYNALPAPDKTAELQLCVGKELGFAAAWYGTLDDSGRCWAQAIRGDITL